MSKEINLGLFAYCPWCKDGHNLQTPKETLCPVKDVAINRDGIAQVLIVCPFHRAVDLGYEDNQITSWGTS